MATERVFQTSPTGLWITGKDRSVTQPARPLTKKSAGTPSQWLSEYQGSLQSYLPTTTGSLLRVCQALASSSKHYISRSMLLAILLYYAEINTFCLVYTAFITTFTICITPQKSQHNWLQSHLLPNSNAYITPQTWNGVIDHNRGSIAVQPSYIGIKKC